MFVAVGSITALDRDEVARLGALILKDKATCLGQSE